VTDPWQTCAALEKWVHDGIQKKNFSQGFATAADVAQSLEGDCTEHAVLLAALCRARQIPARVCVGLVYSPNDQGFAFHMWNEAWITDRWIPLDATLGLGGIGAAHLKLRHSDLSSEQAESAVLSVLQVMNQLQLQVVEVQ
jgi:transglutaminase-like putative cysteine protease